MGLIKKIVLVSSGQPSANPRLVKEAISLDKAGYKLIVIYVPISPWADAFDEHLFIKYPNIKFVKAGYHPHRQKLLYKLARLRRKAVSNFFKVFGDIFNLVDYSTILFGQELFSTAKKHKADLYIAHNLGALPVVVKAAQIHKARVGFDAEDFHRGEFSNRCLEKLQTELIEKKYIPQLDYLTVASSLIGEAYESIFPGRCPVVINNVFSLGKLNQLSTNKNSDELRLFWFSQTIGRNRGIEQVMKAIGLLETPSVSFTLLGNLSYCMHDYLLGVAKTSLLSPGQLRFLDPVPEDELFKIATEFDVGIGAEVADSLNREYCLTNKVFTYLLAGNALVLSDTKAQSEFLNENPGVGTLFKNGDPTSLARALKNYIDNSELLAKHKQNARRIAEKQYNWEIEGEKLVKLVKKTLQS